MARDSAGVKGPGAFLAFFLFAYASTAHGAPGHIPLGTSKDMALALMKQIGPISMLADGGETFQVLQAGGVETWICHGVVTRSTVQSVGDLADFVRSVEKAQNLFGGANSAGASALGAPTVELRWNVGSDRYELISFSQYRDGTTAVGDKITYADWDSRCK